MRLAKLFLVSVVFFALNVCAQTDSHKEPDQPERSDTYGTVIAMPNLGASAYETFDSAYCTVPPFKSKKLKEGTSLIVTGVKSCNPRYGRSEIFYDIWINGKSYLVKSGDVSIRVGDIAVFESMSETDRAEVAEIGKRISIERRIEALDRAMADIKRVEKLGLAIVRKSIYDAGEYADSTSFDIEVLNPTKKTIKYVWISVTGYNAVNDPVRDRFKGGPMLTVKGVGPIEPETTGSYTWKYMWRTTLVQYYKINEIKVQYMDGSTRSIKNIRAIELDKETMSTVEENS